MNIWLVSRFVGFLALGIGLAMLVPASVAGLDHDGESAIAFLASAGVSVLIGWILVQLGKRAQGALVGPREAIGIVGFSWILAGLLGGIPFVLDNSVSHPVDAIFESFSGFTTTGATVIPNLYDDPGVVADPASNGKTVATISRAAMLWRSITHWLGGMGIIVLFVAIFPAVGVGARHLLSNEVPGPITERLRPRLKQTAIRLWWIYLILTTTLLLLLFMAGMDLFDATNHAFSTLATGGYSTRNGSVGAYNSVSIDIIITVFMLVASLNFGLYHLALQGRIRSVLRDSELRAFLILYGVVTIIITLSILDRHGGNPAQALRYASFQTAAVQTGTGFGTDDFNAYPHVAQILLFMLMFIGGCAGSTTGGMKVGRILVLIKASLRELRRNLRPQEVRALRVGTRVVPEGTLRSIAGFITLFLLTYVVATIIVAALGADAVTAGGSVAASLGNIGPGFGAVGPTLNYADLSYPIKSVLTVCMLLGRLELMALLAFILPGLWRKR